MNGIKLGDDMTEGKVRLNGTTYSIQEIRTSEGVIWPLSYTYVISNVSLHYSISNQISASGNNYAYCTGDVEKKRGNVTVETLYGVTLTPSISGYANGFYVSGTEIHAYSRGTTAGAPRTCSFNLSYNTGTYSDTVSVTQQANERTQTSSTETTTAFHLSQSSYTPGYNTWAGGSYYTTGTQIYTKVSTYEWTSGETSTETERGLERTVTGYSITITSGGATVLSDGIRTGSLQYIETGVTHSFYATYDGFESDDISFYQSPDAKTGQTTYSYRNFVVSIKAKEASAASYSSGSITIGCGASSAKLLYSVTVDRDTYETWISGGSSWSSTDHLSLTPTITESGTRKARFTRSGTNVTHSSMLTNDANKRDDVKYTASYTGDEGSGSASVTIYTEYNTVTDVTDSFSFSFGSLSFPEEGGTRTITATRGHHEHYNSGADGSRISTDVSSLATYSSDAPSWITISGTTLTVDANQGSTSRNATITATYGSDTDTNSITQAAHTASYQVERVTIGSVIYIYIRNTSSSRKTFYWEFTYAPIASPGSVIQTNGSVTVYSGQRSLATSYDSSVYLEYNFSVTE